MSSCRQPSSKKAGAAEELEALSPLLASMPKTVPLSIPAGYFDQPGDMAASIAAETPQPAKVIPMRPRRTWYRWAAAACLIALIGSSTLFYLWNNQRTPEVIVTPTLADVSLSDVSDQDIVEYLQTHMDAFDKEDLLSYSDAAEESTPLPAAGDISPEDIQRYLDKTGLLKEKSN